MYRYIDVIANAVCLRLFAEKAAFSKEYATLFIADTHFGKAATFRRSGIPIPQGSTAGTLKLIDNLIEETGASRLVILGDMFHAPSSLSPQVREALDCWFERHHNVHMTLIRGNHDSHVDSMLSNWPIQVLEPGATLGPIGLAHHPGKPPIGANLLMCGHLHPAVRFSMAGDSLGKLPCFFLSADCLVLPAIGKFTGTHPVRPGPGDRTWVIAGDKLVERV